VNLTIRRAQSSRFLSTANAPYDTFLPSLPLRNYSVVAGILNSLSMLSEKHRQIPKTSERYGVVQRG
jgi:hypothetical protein